VSLFGLAPPPKRERGRLAAALIPSVCGGMMKIRSPAKEGVGPLARVPTSR
jgi:hypothetical protein